MILYNITFNIESRFNEQWLKWTKTHLIPAFQNIDSIEKVKILRLLNEIDNGGMTYSVQLNFNKMDDYKQFEANQKEYILDRHNSLFRGKFVIFTTLLEEV
jgi:hypothetical protein